MQGPSGVGQKMGRIEHQKRIMTALVLNVSELLKSVKNCYYVITKMAATFEVY